MITKTGPRSIETHAYLFVERLEDPGRKVGRDKGKKILTAICYYASIRKEDAKRTYYERLS